MFDPMVLYEMWSVTEIKKKYFFYGNEYHVSLILETRCTNKQASELNGTLLSWLLEPLNIALR